MDIYSYDNIAYANYFKYAPHHISILWAKYKILLYCIEYHKYTQNTFGCIFYVYMN